MTVDQILKSLEKECWVVETEMVQEEDHSFSHEIRIRCGVQGRGRYSERNQSFEKCLNNLYKKIMKEYPPIDPNSPKMKEVRDFIKNMKFKELTEEEAKEMGLDLDHE
jgi:hypothetical protein